MRSARSLVLASALLLLVALPSTQAHGHDSEVPTHDRVHDGGAKAMMGSVMVDSPLPPSYFGYEPHARVMYAHIVLMCLSWFVVLPLAVMLSIARSRLTLPMQCAFLVTNGLGLATSIVYNHQTPKLYEGNKHHPLGWAVTSIATAWTLLGLVQFCAMPRSRSSTFAPGQSVTHEAMAEHQLLHGIRKLETYRWSQDSGQGTERNTVSLANNSRCPSLNSGPSQSPTRQPSSQDEEEDHVLEAEKRSFLRDDSPADRFLASNISRGAMGPTLTLIKIFYILLERFIIPLGFAAFLTGIVAYSGIFRADGFFSGLAHFIKGGIFFGYGLLTFGRWMGCFADFGWAWNLKPGAKIVGRAIASIPSAEFVESFVIAIYGASNIFLEHLAAAGGPWTPMDLEHVSITILFFGGGLLGMLFESPRVGKMIDTALPSPRHGDDKSPISEEWLTPESYTHSLNPMPALVILLLGINMSAHSQHSMVASDMHKLWGNLFIGYALARCITYITLWLKPLKGFMPSRPPSEIIASFCLISGGLIFMCSASDVVGALLGYELDAMFIFTIMTGLTALLMAWVVVVIAVKGWAVRRNHALRMSLSTLEA